MADIDIRTGEYSVVLSIRELPIPGDDERTVRDVTAIVQRCELSPSGQGLRLVGQANRATVGLALADVRLLVAGEERKR